MFKIIKSMFVIGLFGLVYSQPVFSQTLSENLLQLNAGIPGIWVHIHNRYMRMFQRLDQTVS